MNCDTALVEVQITSIGGPITRMLIDSACTLKEVKAQLEQERGVPCHDKQIFVGIKLLQDDDPIFAPSLFQEQLGEETHRRVVLLTLVQRTLKTRDLELSQTKRDAGCGATDYLIVVTHIPTGTCCEHEYCCYHPMAGPVRPDPVQNLVIEEVNSELIVKWEWSENSFDLASLGVSCQRTVSLTDGRLTWAGPCKSVKRVKPVIIRPPPAVPLAALKEVLVADLTYDTLSNTYGSNDLVIRHAPSSSVVEYSGANDVNRYQNLKFTQAGGYVRVEFLERWSESGEKGASEITRFLKLNNGRLAWA